MISHLTSEGCKINGTLFSKKSLLDDYISVLGPADICYDGPIKAPVGHRNNHRHIYSNGIYLLDHHMTRLIQEVSFCLHPEHVSFIPISRHDLQFPYKGKLSIGSQEVTSQTTIDEVTANCGYLFTPHLGTKYYAKFSSLSITLEGYQKRKGTSLRLAAIHFDFSE